jgi:hypothetical protein
MYRISRMRTEGNIRVEPILNILSILFCFGTCALTRVSREE